MSTKQERAWERLQKRESNQRIIREVEAAQKAFDKPDSALGLLYSRDFFPLLVGDFGRAGLVGEKRNALVTWLVGTSRLLRKPLNEIAKGRSSSGKNHLVRTVLKFFPQDAIVQATSLSQRAINYLGPDALSHKILYVDELSSENRNHPVRQLISEGRVIHRVPVMKNGRWVTEEIVTEGPVACITTTTATALKIDDESRNFSVWINESYGQTKAIAKSFVASDCTTSLEPGRLALWHAVQQLIARISEVPVEVPPWFELVVEKILPYGDLRIRRYWPAFLDANRLVCMVRNANRGKKDIERRNGLTISFEDFAITTHIFDRTIAESLVRSGRDEDLAVADIVGSLMATGLYRSGISAGNLVGQPGISSLDKAYRLLSRAEQAGTIFRSNRPAKNNEKLYMRSAGATFLGDPVVIAQKLGLKIAGTYVHPINGKSCSYGKQR